MRAVSFTRSEPSSLRRLRRGRRVERRRFEARCDVISPDFDRPLPHRVGDLSEAGLWIHARLPLPLGQTVVVSLPRPEGELSVFAEVVRVVRTYQSRRGGMGLRFTALDHAERSALDACLAENPPSPRDALLDVAGWHLARSA